MRYYFYFNCFEFFKKCTRRACISIREDEIASEAMGINTTKYKTIAFVIGAVLASLAGALYASNFYVIKPDLFTWAKSVDVLIFVVFGGMGVIQDPFIRNCYWLYQYVFYSLSPIFV